MIPLYDNVLTKENFENFESFENHNIVISRTEEGIVIRFKNTYPSNLFFYEGCYCLNEEVLKDYLVSKGIEVSVRKEFSDWERKKIEDKKHWSVRQLTTNKYYPIERISKLWKLITIHPNMAYEVVYDIPELLSKIPTITSIERWAEKYKGIIGSFPKEKIIFELSAGLDSRVLTQFYNKDQLVYSKDCFELEIVKKIAQRIPIKVTTKKPESMTTVSGMGNFSILTVDLLENWVGALHYKHLVTGICPYLDKDYLKLLGDLKKILNVLFCPNLIDIPYISFADRPFVFDEDIIKNVESLIENIRNN